MLGRSKLVQEKIIKSQNVDFWFEKSKFDVDLNGEMTILPFNRKIQHFGE